MENTIWHGLILFGQGKPQDPTSGLMTMLPMFAIVGLLFYFLMIRPQRREQAQRATMLDAIKKNDRVVTIGGIHGVVTNVLREAGEVTIKVDEATNTKIRLSLASVARVLGEESKEK